MSHLTLQNDTWFPAVFVVKKGEMTIARTPAVVYGAALRIPTGQAYTAVAATVIEGNTYTSAPIAFSGAAGFLARVVQRASQDTYEFEMVELPARSTDLLEFQNTTRAPVTFTLSRQGLRLQTVVVNDAFKNVSVSLAGSYSIYAIVNGVTTGTIQTDDPDAVITARLAPGGTEAGDFELVVG